MIRHLRSLLVRLVAFVLLVGIVAGVPVAVVRLIGRPWPDPARARIEFRTGHVTTDTAMRLTAALALIVWAWAAVTILIEISRVLRHTTTHTGSTPRRATRAISAPTTIARRPSGVLQGLVRLALVGTLSTASVVTSSTAAYAARPVVAALVAATPVRTGAPPSVVAAPTAVPAGPVVIADGTQTALSIAVDLGDESLRDEIVALNRSKDWAGGVFPAGSRVHLPATATATAASTSATTELVAATSYEVADGDGMWTVSEALLGDGSLHHHLEHLVAGQQVAPDVTYRPGAMLQPGWVFTLPTTTVAAAAPAGEHLVAPGESLSAIALQHYGDAAEWPLIWDANRGRDLGGVVFDNPNLIKPGWTLTIPPAAPREPLAANPAETATSVPVPAGPAPSSVPPPPTDATPTPPPPAPDPAPATVAPVAGPLLPPPSSAPLTPPPSTPAPATSPMSSPSVAATVSRPPAATLSRPVRMPRVWLAGLSSTMLLASALYARSWRLRRRLASRGGSNLSALRLSPSDQATEEALAEAADLPLTCWANHALTGLVAAHGTAGSHIDIVELGDCDLRVWWAPPLTIPPAVAGWTHDPTGRIWTLTRPPESNTAAPVPAAIPSLVTIGRTDDRNVMINLEAFGGLLINGDAARADELVRSIVLELGADGDLSGSIVHTIGLDVDGTEHLSRVRSRAEADTRTYLARRVDDIDANTLTGSAYPTMFALRAAVGPQGRDVVVVTARADALVDPDGLFALAPPERGVAVVIAGASTVALAPAVLTIDASGAATLIPVGMQIQACGMPRSSAAAIAILFDHLATAFTDTANDAPTVALEIPTTAAAAPDPELVVRIFGTPRVDGYQLGLAERQLLTYLACHHGENGDDDLLDTIWSGRRDRSELWALVEQLRSTVGPLVPSRPEGSSSVTVAAGVVTDAGWAKQLLGRAIRTDDPAEAVTILSDAFALLTGPPFDATGFEWAMRDGTLADAIQVIETVCGQLATCATATGDHDLARVSVRHGLALLGVSEPLTQQLIVIEQHAGEHGAARAAYREHAAGLAELADSPDVAPTATTLALLVRVEAAHVACTVVERDREPHRPPGTHLTRPRTLLRCFGGVAIDGAVVSQAVAVPFVVAAADRPLTDSELAEITGYNRKTLGTVWTTTNGVLHRDNGALTLAEGVWTDHGWIAEQLARSRDGHQRGDRAAAVSWLQRVFTDLSRLDGRAFERPTGKKEYWRWVDEYPTDLTARNNAEQHLVATTLDAITHWQTVADLTSTSPDQVVVIACSLARLLPFTAVAGTVRPGGFRSAGECLLLAGHQAAGTRTDLTALVDTTAKQLVAAGLIEPSDELADALDL